MSPQRNARPWQGQVEPPETGTRAGPRSGLLSVSGQRARARRSKSRIHVDVRIRQRLSCPDVRQRSTFNAQRSSSTLNAEVSTLSAQESLLIAQPERGHLPRGLLLAAARSDARVAWTTADIRAVIDALDRGMCGRGDAAMGCVTRTIVREPRRDDGRQQPASARSDSGRPSTCRTSLRVERAAFARHRARLGTCLLCDYAARRSSGSASASSARTTRSSRWCRSGPTWPFETLVLSRRHVGLRSIG